MNSEAGTVEYGNAPPTAVGPGYFACPLCRRTVDRGGRGEGFRKAGLRSHIWACWVKSLAARGRRPGTWSEKRNGYRIVKVKR